MELKPYLQLIRLPNVFTAAADSLAGWLLVGGALIEPRGWVPLVVASACFYAGGIALNDLCDVDVDRSERPGRPLPSGRVGLIAARGLATILFVLGLALAVSASLTSGLIAVGLVVAIGLYNTVLKKTPLAPELMGLCRGLNLALGLSASADFGGPVCWLAAFFYGLVVTGVTWISRAEVHTGQRRTIALGAALQGVALSGWIGLASLAAWFPSGSDASLIVRALGVALLLGITAGVGRKSLAAYRLAEPRTIQPAIKFAILSLVWLHAGLILSVRGPVPAAAVAAFWFPAAFSGRWIYST